MLAIRHAALSHPGLKHTRNDDFYYVDAQRGLYFVTDGMANQATPHFIVDTLPPLLQKEFDENQDFADPQAAAHLQALLGTLNEQFRLKRSELVGTCGKCGATLVLALVRSGQALLAYMGDSRIYLHRAGQLVQLTRDHSVVQHMLDTGWLTPDEAVAAPSNGGPTRFIGMPGQARADVLLLPLEAGDRLLLCSDGLTEMLEDDDIQAILRHRGDLPALCQHLVDAANVAGGRDNVTVLLIGAG